MSLEGNINRLSRSPSAAVYSTLEFLKAKAQKKEIEIPRTSLAVFATMAAAFPEIGTQENLIKTGALSPSMIALNEAADIGVSAELRIKKSNLTQSRLWSLTLLRNQVFKNLDIRKDKFLKRYPEEKESIEIFINDFLNLSRLRNEFSIENWPTFLELDSAIFVCAYLNTANHKILKEAQINIKSPSKTKEEIERKYQLFLIPINAEQKLNSTQRKVKAIFAAEMLLKINDDLNDVKALKIDKFLRLPNFAEYIKYKNPTNPEDVLKAIKTKYKKSAEILFPDLIQKTAETLRSFTSTLKARKTQKYLPDLIDPTNFWSCFSKEKQTTTLRHELEGMSIISELFS